MIGDSWSARSTIWLTSLESLSSAACWRSLTLFTTYSHYKMKNIVTSVGGKRICERYVKYSLVVLLLFNQFFIKDHFFFSLYSRHLVMSYFFTRSWFSEWKLFQFHFCYHYSNLLVKNLNDSAKSHFWNLYIRAPIRNGSFGEFIRNVFNVKPSVPESGRKIGKFLKIRMCRRFSTYHAKANSYVPWQEENEENKELLCPQ